MTAPLPVILAAAISIFGIGCTRLSQTQNRTTEGQEVPEIRVVRVAFTNASIEEACRRITEIIKDRSDGPATPRLWVDLSGCSIKKGWYPFELEGAVDRFIRKYRVDLANDRKRGFSPISMDGTNVSVGELITIIAESQNCHVQRKGMDFIIAAGESNLVCEAYRLDPEYLDPNEKKYGSVQKWLLGETEPMSLMRLPGTNVVLFIDTPDAQAVFAEQYESLILPSI